MTYIGAGMICPHIVNFSLLFGGILSWAVLWPLISRHAGDWYPATATGSNIEGLYGYKVNCKTVLLHVYQVIGWAGYVDVILSIFRYLLQLLLYLVMGYTIL